MIIAILILILLTSCQMDYDKGDIYYLSYATNYSNGKNLDSLKRLNGTMHDTDGLHHALSLYSEEYDKDYFYYNIRLKYEGGKDDNDYKTLTVDNNSDKNLNCTSKKPKDYDWDNEELTKNFINFTNEFKSKIKDNDIVIFAFSGHGAEDTGILALDEGINIALEQTGNTEGIYEFMSAFKGNKIIILDSCFSGNIINADGDSSYTSHISDIYKKLDAKYGTRNNMYLIAASSADKLSYEDSITDETFNSDSHNKHSHGQLFKKILTELNYVCTDDYNTPGHVTDFKRVSYSSICSKIKPSIANLFSSDHQFKQTPYNLEIFY